MELTASGGNQLPLSCRWCGSQQSGLQKDHKVSVCGGARQQENAGKGCWDVIGMNWKCRKGQIAAVGKGKGKMEVGFVRKGRKR